MFTYVLWIGIFLWLPVGLLWLKYKQLVLTHKKTMAVCAFGSLLFGVSWDSYAVNNQIWSFPAVNNLGVYFLGLPIEEYLFIVFVTLFICTVTLILRNKLKVNRRVRK